MLECGGGFLRPGGEKMTLRAAELCGFSRGDRLIDIGAGGGRAVKLLNTLGFAAVGVDVDAALADGVCVLHADAARLPFPSGAFSGALMECSLSRINEPDEALKECARVLKDGGRLALSDVVSRGDEAFAEGMLGRLESAEHIRARLERAGFTVLIEEDYTEALRTYFAELLLENGREAISAALGAPYDAIKRAKCGYTLIISEKAVTRGA